MEKIVFISHSSRNAKEAQQICDYIESEGLKCWIAPRDVRPGHNWDEEIAEGIEQTRVFVLLLSSESNISENVHKELHQAVAQKNPIFPVRIQDVKPGKKFKHLLSGIQWTDAFPLLNMNELSKLINLIKDYIGYKPKDVISQHTGRTDPNDSYAERIKELREQYPKNNIAIIKLKEGNEIVLENFLGFGTMGGYRPNFEIAEMISESPTIGSISLWNIKSITINPKDEIIKSGRHEFLKAKLVSITNEDSEWYLVAPRRTLVGTLKKMGLEMKKSVKLIDAEQIIIISKSV